MTLAIINDNFIIILHPEASEAGSSQGQLRHGKDVLIFFSVKNDIQGLIHDSNVILHIDSLLFGIVFIMLRNVLFTDRINRFSFHLFRTGADHAGSFDGSKAGHAQEITPVHMSIHKLDKIGQVPNGVIGSIRIDCDAL